MKDICVNCITHAVLKNWVGIDEVFYEPGRHQYVNYSYHCIYLSF